MNRFLVCCATHNHLYRTVSLWLMTKVKKPSIITRTSPIIPNGHPSLRFHTTQNRQPVVNGPPPTYGRISRRDQRRETDAHPTVPAAALSAGVRVAHAPSSPSHATSRMFLAASLEEMQSTSASQPCQAVRTVSGFQSPFHSFFRFANSTFID